MDSDAEDEAEAANEAEAARRANALLEVEIMLSQMEEAHKAQQIPGVLVSGRHLFKWRDRFIVLDHVTSVRLVDDELCVTLTDGSVLCSTSSALKDRFFAEWEVDV